MISCPLHAWLCGKYTPYRTDNCVICLKPIPTGSIWSYPKKPTHCWSWSKVSRARLFWKCFAMLLPIKIRVNLQVPTEWEIYKSFPWFRSWKARNNGWSRLIYSQGINSSSPLIPVNLPTVTKPAGTPWTLTSLPSLGQGTLSPIQCTPHVEFPAFPQPLCRQYPIQTELKVTSPPKRIINQLNYSFWKKNHHQYYLSFSEHSPRVQDSGNPCEFWCYPPYDARLMQLCLLSVSLLSISDTIPGGHHTLDPWTKYPAISDIGLIKL